MIPLRPIHRHRGWRTRFARLGAVALAAAVALVAAPALAEGAVGVEAKTGRAAATVGPRYMSIAVDIDQVVGGEFWNPDGGPPAEVELPPYDFDRPALVRLTRALLRGRPAYLRLSGTGANKTYYDLSKHPVTEPPPGYQRVLTKAQWDGAMKFAERLGMKVWAGINTGPGPRDSAYRWLPDNAREFLRYNVKKGYPLAVVEYGNEPNMFGISGIPSSYNAADYARDSIEFKALVEDVAPKLKLVGPGTFLTPADPDGEEGVGTALGPIAADILPLLPRRFYDAMNYHYYNGLSTRLPFGPHIPDDPLDPAWLTDQVVRSARYMQGLGERYQPGAPLWLGETSTAAGGGQIGYSDRFIASFYHLNELGTLGRLGVSVLVRQTLQGSNYGLLDATTGVPDPDYWATLLWERLIGREQLNVKAPDSPETLKLFGACSTGGPAGGVTLLALNLSRDGSETLRLKGPGGAGARAFVVTAPDLYGTEVMLNGRELRASKQGRIKTDLAPKPVRGRSLTLPPTSYAFVREPRAGARACGV